MKLSITGQEWLYVLKCMLGAVICYLLYLMFPQYPMFWGIISVVLVVSPENDNKLPYIRIEGNLLGSAVGLLVFFLPFPTIILLCLGIGITVTVCLAFKLQMIVRQAAAATIIVLFQEKSGRNWQIALERVGCVMVGCVVGLLITLLFVRIEKLVVRKKGDARHTGTK